MPDQPTAVDLLRTARQTLLETLLPALPRERHYEARIIANAMAIAAREAEAGGDDLQAGLARVRELYDTDAQGIPGSDPETTLVELNRRLARDLRAGHMDTDIGSEVYALLLEQTRARLRISNPRHLASWGLS